MLIALACAPLISVELAADASAQQVNPYAIQTHSAHSTDAQFASTRQSVARTHSPSRLPSTSDDGTATKSEIAIASADFAQLPEPAVTARFEPIQVKTQTWLPSVTPSTQYIEGRRLLDQSHHEYSVSAFASAEASAWESLRRLAAAVDASNSETTSPNAFTASHNLELAEHALREARDFTGKYGVVDSQTIKRLVRCHQTNVLKSICNDGNDTLVTVSATEAVDRYMNEARVRLSPIAARSVDAAEAMDLLAAIYLGRYQPDALPNETSLSLRRAALQGQPGNAMLASSLGCQLAHLGLIDESRWALQHSLSIQYDPQTAQALVEVIRRSGEVETAEQMRYALQQQLGNTAAGGDQRVPEVVQLSPEQFAALSQPVMLQNAASNVPIQTQEVRVDSSFKPSVSLASARLSQATSNTAAGVSSDSVQSPPDIEPPATAKPSFFRNLMKRVRGSK